MLNSINIEDDFIFEVGDISLKYSVEVKYKSFTEDVKMYYLSTFTINRETGRYYRNDTIFHFLKIINYEEFCSKIYGHDLMLNDTTFPSTYDLKSLLKLINKLYELIDTYAE